MDPSRQPVSFIATDTPDAARAFYTEVMQLDLLEASPFALVFSDQGHILRVQIVPALTPVDHTAHGWQVADIEQEIDRLRTAGVEIKRFEQLPQDKHGVWTSPDGHKIAWFTDPSGNILSLTERSEP